MIGGSRAKKSGRTLAVKEIFEAALDLGGTLSGEHGIGITKAPYLAMELGDMGVEVMKRIKNSFDPNNILNPGKIFPDAAAGQSPLTKTHRA